MISPLFRHSLSSIVHRDFLNMTQFAAFLASSCPRKGCIYKFGRTLEEFLCPTIMSIICSVGALSPELSVVSQFGAR